MLHRTPNIPLTEVLPSSKRQFNLTFSGNIGTNKKRGINILELSNALGFNISGHTIFTNTVFGTGSGPKFIQEMLHSKLCLNIKGFSAECHRFYEALECGCIPVIVSILMYVYMCMCSVMTPSTL